MLAFAALADDTRRRIVESLGREERSVGDLVASFAISQPAVSQHLKVLRDAGLVRVRAQAQRRLYSLDLDGVAEIEAWLDRHVRRTAARLDALERHLDQTSEDDHG